MLAIVRRDLALDLKQYSGGTLTIAEEKIGMRFALPCFESCTVLHRVVWKIAAPMIGLGTVLLCLGMFAAWNVNKQQQASSDLISRELHVMLVFPELQLEMREIRYRLNQFLRTKDRSLLKSIQPLHVNADRLLTEAKSLARLPEEQSLIHVVETGYDNFFADFQRLSDSLLANLQDDGNDSEFTRELTHLVDEKLTNDVLQPLRECVELDQQVVERTNEASHQTAQHLRIGFLLLGLCGGAAGLLLGLGIARAVGRSIVQLNVSVRGVAGKLQDVKGPVTFSHTGDLQGIESALQMLEQDIAAVVELLQKRETELLRSEQLAQVGQLAAGLAHELRNPLMPMKILVQAAIARGDDAGLKGRALHVINDEIGRLEQSIQAFLDFARPPLPEKTSVDLNEVVQHVIELVSGKAQRQAVVIRPNLPRPHLVASVDRTQIRQLVLNLVLNALDALPHGGVIDLHVEPNVPSPVSDRRTLHDNRPFPEGEMTEHDALRLIRRYPHEHAMRPASWCAIRIADGGSGVPPELLDSLFEPFVTTKETGTGLGLSICQRIATAHQGILTVHNRPTGGAEFVLKLPYAA